MAARRADSTRTNELRRIFQKLYPNATRAEISTFYLWLQDNHRDLLPESKDGDSYQQLSAELAGLWDKKGPAAAATKSKRKR
jgi:hypothetical protein